MRRRADVGRGELRAARTLLGEVLEGVELTPRELEVLAGAAAGDTAAETGARLFLAAETVRVYRKRILAKLGARSTAQAVAIALRRGLIT